MKNHLKVLFRLSAATLLIAGCSSSEIEAKAEIPQTPEPIKETKTMLCIKTTKGDIKIELDAEKAPNTVANFMKYVESGHYSNTIFHRIIDNFMIQGGGLRLRTINHHSEHHETIVPILRPIIQDYVNFLSDPEESDAKLT